MAQKARRGVRGRDHERHRGHDHDDDDGNHRRNGADDDNGEPEGGDNPARQAALIAQRWVGSAPPTAELYARARRQWLALPGALSRPAADVPMPAAPAPPTEPQHDKAEGAS